MLLSVNVLVYIMHSFQREERGQSHLASSQGVFHDECHRDERGVGGWMSRSECDGRVFNRC